MADELYSVPDDLGLGATVRGFVEGQELFGRYVLKRILGRGGMGVVWLALDHQLDRKVALKFLPELITLDKEAIADLKRETKRSLELTHPHIVRIYDFVQDSSWAGISMEYVDGETLSALKVERPNGCFDVETLRPWARQLTEALEYAHTRAKVVHRDLKPANLMVNKAGELKIADFGIARSVSDSISRVTLRQGTSGTLAYMSPQQAKGQKTMVSDDIYSVGATLYDLLAGKPPFYTGEIYQQLLSEAPVSIAARREELDLTGEPIPAEWEETIAACLAKEPEQRPQSIAEVAERLGLRASPIPNGSLPPRKKVATQSPPPKRGQPLLVAALVVAILLAGGLGYYFGMMVPAEQARQAEIAKQEAIQKEKEAAVAEALRIQQEKDRKEAERLAAARGGVMLKTDPEGATVAVGGEDVQTSPATFKSLKLGKYPLHISLDGYEPVDQQVEIKENEFADLGTITLMRSKGALQIATTPPDADYQISNATLGIKQSGKAPDTIKDLPVGTYDVIVTRGDWSIPGTASVKRNDTVIYSPAFTYGSATITSVPGGATVTENGKALGKTPLTIKDLRVGAHTFALELAGYKGGSASADITDNAAASLSATLEKIPLGSARITSDPSGATVSEHGKELGQTPLTLSELSLGKHTFSFALSGYKSSSATAQIASDAVSDVAATLQRKQIFAGTWMGMVSVILPSGATHTYDTELTVSANESSVSCGQNWDAHREGNTLTWSEATADCTSTVTLQLLSNGKASFINEFTYSSHATEGLAGTTHRLTGTLTKQPSPATKTVDKEAAEQDAENNAALDHVVDKLNALDKQIEEGNKTITGK